MKCARICLYVLQCAANQRSLRTTGLETNAAIETSTDGVGIILVRLVFKLHFLIVIFTHIQVLKTVLIH
jgi:hypothetical protein